MCTMLGVRSTIAPPPIATSAETQKASSKNVIKPSLGRARSGAVDLELARFEYRSRSGDSRLEGHRARLVLSIRGTPARTSRRAGAAPVHPVSARSNALEA